jgi:hypothetical protein
VVGISSTLTWSVSDDGGHTPLETVHKTAFIPVEIPASSELVNEGLATTPVPEITDQVPEPITGTVAFIVTEDEHTTWSGPASAVEGIASRKISTVEVETGQIPFPTDHWNTLAPVLRAFTLVLGTFELLNTLFPNSTDHVPVPNVCTTAANVAFAAHKV